MSVELPDPGTLFKAVDVYLRHAYAPGGVPKEVERRLQQLREAAEIYACPAVENANGKHLIRLGNRFYPHMKLCLEQRPDRKGYLFRADTHDRHVRPAEGSRDAAMFREIVEKNSALSKEIEEAWVRQEIPTFRTYLKEDLARRAAKGGAT